MFWKEFKTLTLKKKFEYLGMAILLGAMFYALIYAAAILEAIKQG